MAPASSKASAPGSKPQPKAQPPSPAPQQGPAKKAKTDKQSINECQTYFNRVSSGQMVLATDNQKAEATVALKTLTALDDGDKAEFAKKFIDTKKTKQFGWIREYREKITFEKDVVEGFKQNYMTRS